MKNFYNLGARPSRIFFPKVYSLVCQKKLNTAKRLCHTTLVLLHLLHFYSLPETFDQQAYDALTLD